MVFDDNHVRVLMMACVARGILVPEEVAFVGCNNDLLRCRLSPVQASSVDPDYYRLGVEAVSTLERMLDGEPAPEQPILIPPKGVVVRASSDIVAVDHLGAARALHFIHANYADPRLRVGAIAEAAGMSRRTLESVFRAKLGCAIAEYVRQVRLKRAKELLMQGDQKIADVARQCGFSNMTHLGAALRSESGLGPRQWRQEHKKPKRKA